MTVSSDTTDNTHLDWYTVPTGSSALLPKHSSVKTNSTMVDLDDIYDVLGKSLYIDTNMTANARYNEVHIWRGALSEAMLETLHAMGPNALP